MAIITSYWILYSIMVLMVAAYLFMTRKFNYWKDRGVFEIKPLPFFGNIMNYVFLKQSPGSIIKDLYEKTKGQPYMGFYIFDRPCLLIRDREIIKDILVKDFNYFCNRYMNSDPGDRLGRSTIPLMRNPTWKIIRAKLTPFFTSGKLKRIFDLLMECTINLDRHLDSLGLDDKGKAMDVKDLVENLATDMIGSSAYSLNIDSVNNSECEFRKSGRAMFDFDIFRGFQLFMNLFYPEISRILDLRLFGKESIFFRKVFWDIINHRIKSGQKRGDLIYILIDLKKEYAGQSLEDFSKKNIINNINNFDKL